jgi:hypothetical protein
MKNVLRMETNIEVNTKEKKGFRKSYKEIDTSDIRVWIQNR